ncbi:MAG TPA: PA2169 family four-helix-bundle protein [Chitinophagaceae bacterium]|nr:PA2169 family four-helix-bundle protein [Chitinophagaceae bacterium]
MQTENRDELVQVLNDLVRINNDRVEGYERAIEDTKDGNQDLISVFNKMIDESRQYKSELVEAIGTLGGSADFEETTNSGKIYRFWMKIKETLSGGSRGSVLDDCEFGEDAAQKAYQEAIETDVAMDLDTRDLIITQKNALKNSHDKIKRLRDLQKEVSDLKKGQPTRSYN